MDVEEIKIRGYQVNRRRKELDKSEGSHCERSKRPDRDVGMKIP